MKTNDTGDPLPSCNFDAIYDRTLHDGEVEGPCPVWCSPSGVVTYVGDPDIVLFGAHPPDFYSVHIHCRAGGTDCVGDFKTAEDARHYIEYIEAKVTYLKGFE
jgi:hypothetical protein